MKYFILLTTVSVGLVCVIVLWIALIPNTPDYATPTTTHAGATWIERVLYVSLITFLFHENWRLKLLSAPKGPTEPLLCITFPNGDIFTVPCSVITDHMYAVHLRGGTMRDYVKNRSKDSEGLRWYAVLEMSWSEIAPFATCTNRSNKPIIYDKEYINAQTTIIQPNA